jgi:hypothetical protein
VVVIKKTILIYLIFIAILLSSTLFSQDVCKIEGRVFDSAAKIPIQGVNVIVRGTSIGAATDNTGYFKLELEAGEQYVITFSSLGYKKQIKNLSLDKPKEVEYRINLKQEPIEIDEIVVTGEKSFEDARAQFFIDGTEFERLGEDDMEKALIYFLPDIVNPLNDRLKIISPLSKLTPFQKIKMNSLLQQSEEPDFTLYVNKEWKDTIYLDQIDPYSIKYIRVWKAVGGVDGATELSNDMSPVGLDLRTGKCVVHIVTK